MDGGEFTIDGAQHVWSARSFGPSWNGWATPRVTRTTLEKMLSVLDEGSRWEGDAIVLWPTIDLAPGEPHDPETEDRLVSDDLGMYDLGQLGWTFIRVLDDDDDARNADLAGQSDLT